MALSRDFAAKPHSVRRKTGSVMCAGLGRQTSHGCARLDTGAGVRTVRRTAPAVDDEQAPGRSVIPLSLPRVIPTLGSAVVPGRAVERSRAERSPGPEVDAVPIAHRILTAQRRAHNTERGARRPVGSLARRLFARCLECVGKSSRGVGDRRIGRHDLCQAVARARYVELLDGSVESGPEFLGPAPASPGTEFVGRPRAVGPSDRSPCQARLEGARVRIAHRCCGLRQGSQTTTKTRIRRRHLVRAHRSCPRPLCTAHGIPSGLLMGDLWALLFGSLHEVFLSHAAAVGQRRRVRVHRANPLFAPKIVIANTHTRVHTTILV
jgi:hypothetical protein